MNRFYSLFSYLIEPFTSPFYLFLFVLIVALFSKRRRLSLPLPLLLLFFSGLFYGVYRLAGLNQNASIWLYRLNSPFVAVLSLMVLPALLFPKDHRYNLFLLIPALCIVTAIIEVIFQYRQAPTGSGFIWFPIQAGFLICAITGFLIIIQRFVSLDIFRKVTRVTIFVLLIYGGFAFRQSYNDYKAMLSQRRYAVKDIMMISETTPVMKEDNRLTYLPSAPCRFSADGGYIQGCVMELLQRAMQVPYGKIFAGDPSEVAILAIILAAVLVFFMLAYIGARWWCGWICPLSTLGDIFDMFRRWFHLPHLKPSRPVKLAYLFSGLSFGGIGLLLSKAYANINEKGEFLGCKIPVYPFCKLCPGQQVCPVASQGLAGYPALPGTEWLFGFFRYGMLLLLGLFLVGFIVARRLWCRFCPMGMLGGIFNRGGFIALKKNARKCNGCGVCNEVCPMDIHIVQKEMQRENVSSFDCVYCLRCVDNCPQDGCLSLEFAGTNITNSKMKMLNG
jgi:ferredoxin-type protein NapH